jgi:GT2 family glycosyltransferase
MAPVGKGLVQEAVADAMSSPAGIGWSRFHLGTYSGYTDTVYLGTFRRSIFDRVGVFDPEAHPAEDAELNCRILAAGERIWLDSSIRVKYYPRKSFGALARQFFWYGRARCNIIKKHGRLFTLGRVAPPLLVVTLLVSVTLAAVLSPLWLLYPAAYLTGLLATATWMIVKRRRSQKLMRVAVMVSVLAIMHSFYGTGFLLKWLNLLR